MSDAPVQRRQLIPAITSIYDKCEVFCPASWPRYGFHSPYILVMCRPCCGQLSVPMLLVVYM